MDNVEKLEKLADLKKKGIISKEEFEEQKKEILKATKYETSTDNTTAKSRIGYILLGIFLGNLGIHNFYAGYSGKGIAQLLITLFTFWLVLPLVAVWIWVIVEICTVDTDAHGNKFV